MIQGHPAYTALGGLTVVPAGTKKFLRFVNQAEWIEAAELDTENTKIWGEDKWDFTGRDDISDIRFTLSYKVAGSDVFSAYSKLGVEDLEFGVRVWNKETRRRTWHRGTLALTKDKVLEAKFDSNLDLQLTLAKFSGQIEIQPLVVSNADVLTDHNRLVPIRRGSILGWSDPIVIDLDKTHTGIGAIFEIKWKSFSEDPVLADSFFSTAWSSNPVLYLNEDHEELKTVLMSEATHGPVARLRDVVNSLVAHQVVSSALTAALAEIFQLSQNQDPSEILENLSPQNEAVLRQWGWMLSQRSEVTRLDDIVADLVEEIESPMGEIIVDAMVVRIQQEFRTEKAVLNLVREIAGGQDAE